MRTRRTAAERQTILEAWKDSGLTQQAFADQHNLNVGTLRNWIYKRRDPEPVRFLEVVPTPTTTPTAATLWINDTLRLELPDLPDPDWLARLVAVLKC